MQGSPHIQKIIENKKKIFASKINTIYQNRDLETMLKEID